MFERCTECFRILDLVFLCEKLQPSSLASATNQNQKRQQKKAKQTKPSAQRSLMDTIYIEIYLKNNEYIIYGKIFHSFFPFFCCFTAVLSSYGYLFWPAVTVTRWERWRVKYLFCSCQRGDEEQRSRRRRRRHRHCAGLSFGSSVALSVMWLLPSWLKMNQ